MIELLLGRKYALAIKNNKEGTVLDTLRAYNLPNAMKKARKIRDALNELEKEVPQTPPTSWFIQKITRLTE